MCIRDRYTHNLGIYSFENLNSNKVFGNSETLEGNKIDTKVPVYTMNDLIMNGLNSTIKLQDGFYGINSNSGDKTLTGEKQNSSAKMCIRDRVSIGGKDVYPKSVSPYILN